MKQIQLPLDASPWAGREIRCPFSLIDAVFEFAQPEYYKNTLTELVTFMFKPKIYHKKSPDHSFIVFAVLHSLLRAAYLIHCKSGQYKINAPKKDSIKLCYGSLNSKEFQNPLIVFKNAYSRKNLEGLNLALFEMVSYALNSSSDYPTWDLITPYIHLCKILDASWQIHQRRIE